ncbi:MAG: hypothetical protein AB7T49_21010 [Oligoflexales bacterium]
MKMKLVLIFAIMPLVSCKERNSSHGHLSNEIYGQMFSGKIDDITCKELSSDILANSCAIRISLTDGGSVQLISDDIFVLSAAQQDALKEREIEFSPNLLVPIEDDES